MNPRARTHGEAPQLAHGSTARARIDGDVPQLASGSTARARIDGDTPQLASGPSARARKGPVKPRGSVQQVLQRGPAEKEETRRAVGDAGRGLVRPLPIGLAPETGWRLEKDETGRLWERNVRARTL